jgi:hypothetical protein
MEEGCLIKSNVAAGSCTVRGVGSRFSWLGKRGLCVIVKLNMRWASHGERRFHVFIGIVFLFIVRVRRFECPRRGGMI